MKQKKDDLWHKFLKNRTGFLGFIFIIISSIAAISAFFWIPDKSINANNQNLSIATLSPCSVAFFLVDANKTKKPFNGFINGFDFQGVALLVDTAWQKTTDLWVYRLKGEKTFVEISGNFQLQKRFYLIGTDAFGRDMLSRLILGLRISLLVGLGAALLSVVIGSIVGAIAGYFGGKVDYFLQYVMQVIWSLPTLLVVIGISLALGKGLWQIFVAIGITMWVDVARLVRGQTMSLKNQEFIEACKALGFGAPRIILKHILPNCIGPILIMASANFAAAMLIESGLSFLGVGVQPPTPSLGGMIKENYPYLLMGKSYLAWAPGILILLLIVSFNVAGNSLSDAGQERKSLL